MLEMYFVWFSLTLLFSLLLFVRIFWSRRQKVSNVMFIQLPNCTSYRKRFYRGVEYVAEFITLLN